ncbi:DUF2785 domain-containing protein [Deinococcus oregonensis]|uniref:DUF2785 domain-containing protein n=1 Tax=Deinococcus oregonensis TaxID=1805970 RepID=A0ABV6B1M0_9DEIO
MIDWQKIVRNDYVVPDSVNPIDLLPELFEMLGNSDPKIRDEQARSTLAHWIRVGYLDAALRDVGDECATNLQSQNVLLRSFSALILGESLRRYRINPFLAGHIPAIWIQSWYRWYSSEPDVRSFDEDSGWIYTVAHGADVACQIALLETSNDGLRHLTELLTERLVSLPIHLNQGEDDRLALAMLAILSQPDFEPEDTQHWMRVHKMVCLEKVAGVSTPGAALALRSLHSLHSFLSLGVTLDDEVLTPAYPKETIEAVQKTLQLIYPYTRARA